MTPPAARRSTKPNARGIAPRTVVDHVTVYAAKHLTPSERQQGMVERVYVHRALFADRDAAERYYRSLKTQSSAITLVRLYAEGDA